MSGSDIGSVRSSWAGRRTSDGKSDFADSVYNSRFRTVSTFPISDSESIFNLGSVGYLLDLQELCVPNYGLV